MTKPDFSKSAIWSLVSPISPLLGIRLPAFTYSAMAAPSPGSRAWPKLATQKQTFPSPTEALTQCIMGRKKEETVRASLGQAEHILQQKLLTRGVCHLVKGVSVEPPVPPGVPLCRSSLPTSPHSSRRPLPLRSRHCWSRWMAYGFFCSSSSWTSSWRAKVMAGMVKSRSLQCVNELLWTAKAELTFCLSSSSSFSFPLLQNQNTDISRPERLLGLKQ